MVGRSFLSIQNMVFIFFPTGIPFFSLFIFYFLFFREIYLFDTPPKVGISDFDAEL